MPENCCVMLSTYLNGEDEIIAYSPKFREYTIPIHDGGTSGILLYFCPWCGRALPPSLRENFFYELEKLGLELNDPNLPPQYQTEAWWKLKEQSAEGATT